MPGAGEAFELKLSQPTQSVFDTIDGAIAQLRTPQRSGAAIVRSGHSPSSWARIDSTSTPSWRGA